MKIMSNKFAILLLCSLGTLPAYAAAPLQPGFVYLKDVDPTIQQDIRYAGYHNFIGQPIKGYIAAECILTKEAAIALSQVQTELKKSSLSLKVYDCYRPQMAVDHFIAWSKDSSQQQTKAEFYPRVNKADVFKLGYVAEKSGHSRGSTIDLTIVPVPTPTQEKYVPGQQPLVACFSSYHERYRDNSIDMGTGFDCLDTAAHADNHDIPPNAYQNRQLLLAAMQKQGFVPYSKEWWHFTLKDEPYPNTYFNFVVK